MVRESMLSTPGRVAWALLTYTDWWHPPTTSIIQAGVARRNKDFPDGFRSGLLETLDERTELAGRFWSLGQRDRQILFLMYVKQSTAEEIGRFVGISRRQVFRAKAKALRAIVELGEPQAAAS
jgi:DNA-directed RNA polymerase specialized sigma24 family protein